MIRFDRFTQHAQNAAMRAYVIVQRYGHNQVDSEHLLLALLEQTEGFVPKMLQKLTVDAEMMRARVDDILRMAPKPGIVGAQPGLLFITPRLKRVVDRSNEEANRLRDAYISTEHLFLALMSVKDNTPFGRLLVETGITRERLTDNLVREIRGSPPVARQVSGVGKYRHLMQCSTPGGHFNILAIDHRGNLLNSLNRHASAPLTDAEFTAFKQDVIEHLSPLASAVLTDPDYGIGPGIASGLIGGQVGLLSPLEVTDYSVHASLIVTKTIPNWSVEKIKRAGCAGVKLLLFYHPRADNARSKRDLAARVVDECAHYDIPFFLEPIAYSLGVEPPLDNAERREVAVESASTFSQMGVDVLKAEFPLDVKREPDESAWRAALDELSAACTVPWALLSGGVDYATFRRQAELACAAGASGVIVGRAVWGEAVELQGEERTRFLATTGRQRMEELAGICAASARSWREKVAPPEVGAGWYERY